MLARSPDTTVCCGAFRPASDTCAARPSAARAASTSAALASSEAMPPPAGKACIRRPRAATRRQASSRSNTPAAWAAAISPMLWPSSSSGCTPQLSHTRHNATSSANRAGWVKSVRLSNAASALPASANITSSSGFSSVVKRCAMSSSAWRNTGLDWYRPWPMRGSWLPWPVNSRARRHSRSRSSTMLTAPAGTSPVRAYEASASSRSDLPLANTTRRLRKWVRVVASE